MIRPRVRLAFELALLILLSAALMSCATVGSIVMPNATYAQLKDLERATCGVDPASTPCKDVRAELAHRFPNGPPAPPTPAPEEPPQQPPTTTPPGTTPPNPPTPGALIAGDQPQGREWEPAPEDGERRQRLSLRVETVLRSLATTYGCENDDCHFPRLRGLEADGVTLKGDPVAPNGTRAIAEVISRLRSSGLHAGRGDDARSCVADPWPAHCGDDQVSVTDGDPNDPAAVWENVQPVNYGAPVKLRFGSMTQLDDKGKRKLSAWIQKGGQPAPLPAPGPAPPPAPAGDTCETAPLPPLHDLGPHLFQPQGAGSAFYRVDLHAHVEDAVFCAAHGMGLLPDGVSPRTNCPPRPEGHPLRTCLDRRLVGLPPVGGELRWENLSGGPADWQPANPFDHDFPVGDRYRVCSLTTPAVCAEGVLP